MTRLLLDTTFLIAGERGSGLSEDVIGEDDDVAVAAVTIAELRVGALLARGRRRSERSAYVDDVAATVPIVLYDLDVAEAHAALMVAVRGQGRRRGAHDLIIAATARASDRTVLTADERAFVDLPDVTVRAH